MAGTNSEHDEFVAWARSKPITKWPIDYGSHYDEFVEQKKQAVEAQKRAAEKAKKKAMRYELAKRNAHSRKVVASLAATNGNKPEPDEDTQLGSGDNLSSPVEP